MTEMALLLWERPRRFMGPLRVIGARRFRRRRAMSAGAQPIAPRHGLPSGSPARLRISYDLARFSPPLYQKQVDLGEFGLKKVATQCELGSGATLVGSRTRGHQLAISEQKVVDL